MTLDRTGEPIEEIGHDPRCNNGWIDRDGDHPRPCYQCKPHLLPANRRRRLYGGSDPGPHPDLDPKEIDA